MKPHFSRGQDKRIPKLAEIREYANILHLRGEAYHGKMWGWPVHCEPGLFEESALFELPDEENGMKRELRQHYSPAGFTVGESSIWFFSLLWGNGRDSEPVEFLYVVPVEEANLNAASSAAVAAP